MCKVPRNRVSHLWGTKVRDLSSYMGVGQGCSFKVGDWSRVHFRLIIARRWFLCLSSQSAEDGLIISSIEDCYGGWGFSVLRFLLQKSIVSVSQSLDYESVLSLLANIIICREEADINNWKPCPTVVLSSKSTTEGRKQCQFPSPLVHMFGQVWTIIEWRRFVGLQYWRRCLQRIG